MVKQFSLQLIFRRFEGDAASTVIETELIRFAVGVRGAAGGSVGKTNEETIDWNDEANKREREREREPFFETKDFFFDTFLGFSSLEMVSS